MPDLPEDAATFETPLGKPSTVAPASKRDPVEVIEKALALLGVEEPYDAATVVLGALAEQAQVIVSAEDQQALHGLLKELADPEPCWFDHDGGCQAHGPTSTWPRCPHAHARELLAALPERTNHA